MILSGTPPNATAASLLPSAEAATERHVKTGASFETQVVPEFVEVKIEPENVPASNFVPSADEATADQELVGALVCVQVWANAGVTTADHPLKTATAGSQTLMNFISWIGFPNSLAKCLPNRFHWQIHTFDQLMKLKRVILTHPA
jgi:hypothetical protein